MTLKSLALSILLFSLYISPMQAETFSSDAHQPGLDQAIEDVKRQTKGRILSANTITIDGKQTHKIKVLLPSGKVRIIKVNAQ